jgi:hypothetical protein
VVFERQQLWHLAEWLRVRRGGDDAIALQEQLQTIGPNLSSKRFTTVCFVGVSVAIWAILGSRMSMNALIDNTWALHRPLWSFPRFEAVWLVWVCGLGLAYFVHAMSIRQHQRSIDRFTKRLNQLLQKEGVATISTGAQCLETKEISSGWWWTGGILTWFGGLWAIPMSVAGASQRHYINTTSARLRTEMLERVQAILRQRRPAVAVPSYVLHTRRCGNDRCRAHLRAGANFCSRCGSSSEQMSEVA